MQNHKGLQASAPTNEGSPIAGTSPATASAKRDLLEPYIPPNVPHGLPHVVRFATLSSMDLPLEVRFLIIMLARFADVNGVASVAAATLCEICRIGSHYTFDRWLALAADVGILRKEHGKGGKDRRSNSYTFLGQERNWRSLPVGRPDINPIVAQARRRIEDLENQLAPLRDGISPDASPALPTTWADTAATHPRSCHTPYPAVFLWPTPTPDAVSSPSLRPVPCRPIKTTSTQTHCGATSGGIAACGPPPAGPWCRRR